VRRIKDEDVEECDELHKRVVRVSRINTLRRAPHIPDPYSAFVALSETGKILGYKKERDER
jgi:hypothetical protein